jgi:putative peptidoglycan lipid II flippase
VPLLRHAGLALSIGLGALLNAGLLLAGLLRRGRYKPVAGWGVFMLQVVAGSALLAIFLMWGASSFPWVGMRGESLKRVGLLVMMLLGAGAIYFAALAAAGVKLRQFVTR